MKHTTTHQQSTSGFEPKAKSQQLPATQVAKSHQPKALTKIAADRQAHATQLTQVCHYLGWSKQQYCNHQFATYTAFLTKIFAGYPVSWLKDAEYSPAMRGFFNLEWAKRNTKFLPYAQALCFTGIEVTPRGKMQHCDGLPLGCDAVLAQYEFTHSIAEMLDCSQFLQNYNTALKLVMYGK